MVLKVKERKKFGKKSQMRLINEINSCRLCLFHWNSDCTLRESYPWELTGSFPAYYIFFLHKSSHFGRLVPFSRTSNVFPQFFLMILNKSNNDETFISWQMKFYFRFIHLMLKFLTITTDFVSPNVTSYPWEWIKFYWNFLVP